MLIYNRNEAEAFFAYQRTIDTIVSAPSTPETRFEMITEFRQFYQNDQAALIDIDLFEMNYQSDAAIQWFTRDTFLFRLINEILRSNAPNLMFKMRHFLGDLYVQLDQQYNTTYLKKNPPSKEMVYRGQVMSREDFRRFQENLGEVITIKTFFSTTASLQVALLFVDGYPDDLESIPVIISIEIDSSIPSARPYANISQFSIYQDEDEVLFAMGSLFRIRSIEQLDDRNSIHVISLEIIQPTYIEEHPLNDA